MRKTKATVAYFAAKLVEVASDHDRFEAAFVNTDLGGSSISLALGMPADHLADALYVCGTCEKPLPCECPPSPVLHCRRMPA